MRGPVACRLSHVLGGRLLRRGRLVRGASLRTSSQRCTPAAAAAAATFHWGWILEC